MSPSEDSCTIPQPRTEVEGEFLCSAERGNLDQEPAAEQLDGSRRAVRSEDRNGCVRHAVAASGVSDEVRSEGEIDGAVRLGQDRQPDTVVQAARRGHGIVDGDLESGEAGAAAERML